MESVVSGAFLVVNGCVLGVFVTGYFGRRTDSLPREVRTTRRVTVVSRLQHQKFEVEEVDNGG